MRNAKRKLILGILIALIAIVYSRRMVQADEPVESVPPKKTVEEAERANGGCVDCHIKTDAMTMHTNPGVVIGCTDCHGGDPTVRAGLLTPGTPEYERGKKNAHVAPLHPENWPTSANPKRSYTNLLKESPEFVKFVNPGDLRVAPETCGGCHSKIVSAVRRSLMSTSAMLWGGASYNNNILPYKQYVLGESYSREGEPDSIVAGHEPSAEEKARGALAKLFPLPQWESVSPGDNFRVFERGGLNIKSQFPEIGNPNPFEDPGKPDIRQSNRGPGTGNRISVPVLNIHKTRLNDPHLSFMGTNDHPGDYRSSGCTGCHVIYANDKNWASSSTFAKFGHDGTTQTVDPTIPKNEEGHPLFHKFTRSIPTSQCMVCHMHQPNMFVNSYLGYTMWDYESDAPKMWPKEQKNPTDDEMFKSMEHNPEEAAARGKWTDIDFLKKVSDLNPELKDTQFADYHGHGWNFRAIFKRDRKGNLLDAQGHMVGANDPDKFKKAVHLADIHVDKGMQCADCHFGQDSHGDGNIYGEVAQSVEIQCQDCHGTVKARASLRTSGPAAPKDGGHDLSLMRTPFGSQRFVWRGGSLYQRSNMDPNLEWRVKQVRDIIDPASGDYNAKAARAKTVERFKGDEAQPAWGSLKDIDSSKDLTKTLAHSDDKMSCFACHSAWVTSCGGCHLPIQANWKQKSKHYDGKETRNWASYNPQVARDEMFQLGLHGPAKGFKIVPVRSSSALVLSSTDINRNRIYIQQPPISAGGFSSQAFAPHFPHTVRTTETKDCVDCHVSDANDNNAIMAQLMLLGTNFVNFMGFNAWVADGPGGLEAVQVTEWSEPQAVIGSFLHRYAYPANYEEHQKRGQELETSHHHDADGEVNTIQLRGEYLYTTAGSGGFRVYDVASVANKNFSERFVTAPFSPLGQDTHVASKNATSFALPTGMPVAPFRKPLPENLEQPMHATYHYAFITDSEEGLIVVNVDTLADAEPRNNFLKRELTWNPDGVLNGAKFITLAGTTAYVLTPDRMILVDVDDPLSPKVMLSIPFNNPRAVAIQFRYAFVVDADGLHSVDVTIPANAKRVQGADVPLEDGRNIYVARTYAYVAGGKQGLVIVDVERPEKPVIYDVFNDDGKINDLNDVKVATTNASLLGYLADGKNGLKVIQLTDPDRVPTFYGFSPEVKPLVIAHRKTEGPAMALSKGLDRDRAVDESGHQVSVFGRIGSRPFNLEEMHKLYLREDGTLYTVNSSVAKK
ncbi:MAG: hypothetical protein U0136_08465 [Bdellovibrionota bacterium]